MTSPDLGRSGLTRYWMLVVWTGFLGACMLEALVFSMVDPRDVHWIANAWTPSRQTLYSLAFFAFWAITMLCGALVVWLSRPARTVPVI